MNAEDGMASKQAIERIVALISNKLFKEHNLRSGKHSALLKGSLGDQFCEATPNNAWTVSRFLGTIGAKCAMYEHQSFPKALWCAWRCAALIKQEAVGHLLGDW
jgi:hypothetical protein